MENAHTVLYVRSAKTRGLECNPLHTEERLSSLLEKVHDKDYYDKGAFLGRVAAQHHYNKIETEVQNARAVLRRCRKQ